MSDDAPKRVPVLIGNRFGTVDEADLPKMPKGTRVLTPKEAEEREADDAQQAADAEMQAKHDALPTWKKAVGLLGGNPYASPEASAVSEGTFNGLTAGLGHGVVRQGIDAISGKQAGDEYAQRIEQTKTASPNAFGVGQAAGTVASLANPLGEAAEGVAAAGLARAGIQGASTLGRAGIAAAKLGVRGAVEGGIIGGGEYAGEQLLQDHDMAADKLFAATGTGALYGGATGALLGGGTSLLASGAGAARRSLASALSKPADVATGALEAVQAEGQNAVRAAEDAANGAVRGAETAAKDGIKQFAVDLTTEQGTKNRAYDRAWSSIGSGFGLQSTEYVERASKYLKNGTRDVGEVLMRKGILDPKWTAIEATQKGTAAAMLPKIETELETVGQRIGAITDASEGRIHVADIVKAVNDVGSPYAKAAATKPIGKALYQFAVDLGESLGVSDVRQTVSVQDLLRERKALDLMVFDNAALNTSNVATQVKRELRTKLESLVVEALDNSSGRLTGELANEYKALKKDYVALNIAHDVATDSAARSQKAAFLGLGSLVAGGGSLLKAVGHKVVKEHGDAVAATWLYQAAEKGTITRWIAKTDEQIARASKGLIAAPAKGAPKPSEVMPPPRQIVTKALARVASFQANPDAFVDEASRQTEGISAHSPEIANGIVQRQVQAMTFLSSKVPTQGDPDPLDPHPRIRMTPSEESTFARYAYYTEKPDRFFAEVARGKLTPEGAEVAHALMPRAFEDLQAQTFDALTTQLARGNRLPFRQRELIGQLLDFAATPAQRPEHRAFLQQNVSDVLPSNQPNSPAAPKSRRHTMSQNGSALDRLEAGGPGHR